jgi:hypothetical protein
MPESPAAPNYPDILGYITDDQALTLGVVQAALAVRPPVARAGRPFAVILLLQNMSDANVELEVTLKLPAKDAQGRRERFITQDEHNTVTLRPAEVGYLVTTVTPLPDTAPAPEYNIGLDLKIIPLSTKPRLIRRPLTDDDEVNLDYYFSLSEDAVLRVIALKMLEFSVSKRGILSTSTLDVSLGLAAAKAGMPPSKVTDGWFSLWTLGTGSDARPLLERYRDVMLNLIMPKLKNYQDVYRVLYPVVKQRFGRLYKGIEPIEVHYITKMMTYIIRLAPAPPDRYFLLDEKLYTVVRLLKKGWPTDGTPIPLPHWCRGMLHLIGLDKQVVEDPLLAFTSALFDDLLRDAVEHGFRMVQYATQQSLGDEDTLRDYTEHLLELMLHPKRPLSLSDLYLPLILGGITVAEETRMPRESSLDMLHQLMAVYQKRAQTERNSDSERIFKMAELISDWALERYRGWS